MARECHAWCFHVHTCCCSSGPPSASIPRRCSPLLLCPSRPFASRCTENTDASIAARSATSPHAPSHPNHVPTAPASELSIRRVADRSTVTFHVAHQPHTPSLTHSLIVTATFSRRCLLLSPHQDLLHPLSKSKNHAVPDSAVDRCSGNPDKCTAAAQAPSSASCI